MKAKLLWIMCALFLAAVGTGNATPGTGQWWFTGMARVIMSTSEYALDGVDRLDVPSTLAPYGWTAGTYKVTGTDGWDGDTGFWDFDYRAPLVPCQVKTWMLYIWAIPGATPGEFQVGWDSEIDDPDVIARLEYVQKPQGVTGGPALGTLWTSPPTGFTLPFYSTSDGLTGYGFKFALTMVPEPSSLLALACGLAGIGALVMRRRQ